MTKKNLYGAGSSMGVTRAMACLFEKGFNDFEWDPVNPFDQLPAFEDGDKKLFESREITMHLSKVYADKGTPLIYPNNPEREENLSFWLEVEANEFYPPAAKLVYEYVAKPMLDLETDHNVVAENEANLDKVLKKYEDQLRETKSYLTGDTFRLPDLNHLPCAYYLMATPAMKLFDKRKPVKKWVDDILNRESWGKVLDKVKSGGMQ